MDSVSRLLSSGKKNANEKPSFTAPSFYQGGLTPINLSQSNQPGSSAMKLLQKEEALMAQGQGTQLIKHSDSVWMRSAAMYLRSQGQKRSSDLIKDLNSRMDTIGENELIELFLGCKKYSLKENEFDQVVKDSLAKSAKTLSDLGATQDQINGSQPRIEYHKRAEKVRKILKRLFWDDKSLQQNVLSWGNLVRTTNFENFILEIKRSNQSLKPASQQALFSRAYWMVSDFKDNYSEQIKRLTVIVALAAKLSGRIVFKDNNSRGLVESVNEVLSGGENKALAAVNLNEITLASLKEESINIPTNTLLNLAILADAKLLMQSRDFRMTRKSQNDEIIMRHNEMLMKVVEMMQGVMLAHAMFFGYGREQAINLIEIPSGTSFQTFQSKYFESYNIVHTIIRSLKRIYLGGVGGPITRDNDLLSDVGSASNSEKTYTKFTFDLNNNSPKQNPLV